MKTEYFFIPAIPKKLRALMPPPHRHNATVVIDIDERDGCMANGQVMALGKAARSLQAIAEGRYHVG